MDTIELLDISDEEYFSNTYSEYISNSRLKLINPDEGGNPEVYKKGLHDRYSDSLLFGSAVHELLLQPNDFHIASDVDRPTAKAGFMADELYPIFLKNQVITLEDITNASNKIGYYKDKLTDKIVDALRVKCDEYFQQRKIHEAKNKSTTPIYLDSNSRYKLQECLHSAMDNKQIQELLHPKGLFKDPITMNEVTILLDVKVTVDTENVVVLKLKAKIDNFTFDEDNMTLVLNDLKTTGHFLTKFEESFQKYHYYRQMAMYNWMLTQYIKKKYGRAPISNTANMLLVSTVPQYHSGVYKVTNDYIRQGFKEFIQLLKLVAYCEIYGYNRETNLSGIV